MEVKTLLRLIKDDISLLEGITSEFNLESLPTSDEIEVALVRANALLKELNILHKFTDQHESGFKAVISAKELTAVVTKPAYSEQPPAVDLQEVSIDSTPAAHFSALVEPDGSGDVPGDSTVVYEEAVNEPLTFIDESGDVAHEKLFESSEVAAVNPAISVAVETVGVEASVVPDIQDHKEEVVAEEFREVKKTLNETLGESHQLVNDFLAPERSESGYKLIPIDSIWDGIGINDRFLYVRELFANNSAKFEITVAALDELATIQDAVNYLKNNFKWNKTATSQKFLVLVKRRFIK